MPDIEKNIWNTIHDIHRSPNFGGYLDRLMIMSHDNYYLFQFPYNEHEYYRMKIEVNYRIAESPQYQINHVDIYTEKGRTPLTLDISGDHWIEEKEKIYSRFISFIREWKLNRIL